MSLSSVATGEQRPSWARFVATATMGSPTRAAAYFATSTILPPPRPTTASYRLPLMSSASLTAESRVPSVTGYQWAPGSAGVSRSRRARPEPSLIATASLPEAEIHWSARR